MAAAHSILAFSGEIAKAFDEVLVHAGELYIDASRHLAAIEGACDDAVATIRYLEAEAAAPQPVAATPAEPPLAPDERPGRAASSGRGVGRSSGTMTSRSAAPPASPVKPAQAASQRLQLLHAALGKYVHEHAAGGVRGGSPAMAADRPSAEAEAFVRILEVEAHQRLSETRAAVAATAEPSYGELCAAHGAALAIGVALSQAVERVVDSELARGGEQTQLRAVAEQCARQLLDEREQLDARVDSDALARLRARALAHRSTCLDALASREPAVVAAHARTPLRGASEWLWLQRVRFGAAQPPGDAREGGARTAVEIAPTAADFDARLVAAGPGTERVDYGEVCELEARCRARLGAQASGAQLSLELLVRRLCLPLLAQLATKPLVGGHGAFCALFRLLYSVLCAAGRRMPVFLARDGSGG
jgi:hypothetical protein